MTDKTNKPVIFLAFANNHDEQVGYLRNLPEEARRLRDALASAEQAGLCEVEVRYNSTAADIFKVFQNPKYRNRIAVFHYGGHANGYQLLLETAEGHTAAADAGGLAAFLAQQQGLQLVFLNGCSTQQQTQGLLDANVPAVISTSRSIDDRVATDFCCQFYQGLASGVTIRIAYNEAAAVARTAKGDDMRALYFGSTNDSQSVLEADRWPWNLYLREGSEHVDQWSLPGAVNDPLFGLPPLPEQDLPETPYRHLNWFTRQHAEVFFGRGRQIRELYDRLTAPRSAPIILFCGQSGVGKSSILDAGLIPRLEQGYEVRYLRRTAGGLLDTLQLAFLPEASDEPLESAWRVKEQQTGKPLIVFLDQVEEHFTRPIENMPDELDQLLREVKDTFGDPNRRPQGKLVLGFRKEWLAELLSQMASYQLPFTTVILERLDRRGIIEVVSGPARSQRLREQYRLTVDDGLAEIIADDLLKDPGSAVSTTLQILLSKMWTKATDANYEQPRFSQDLYHDLEREGILLSDFLKQQLQAFADRMPEPANSGLLLDVLAQHTTNVGTSNQCPKDVLLTQYAHVSDVLPKLLQQSQDLYLLTEATSAQKEATKTTRLAHDALAHLIRASFDLSDRPGQRARRLLDSRVAEWKDGKTGTPLDEADFKVVETGRIGTRDFNPTEQRLVQASKDKRDRSRRIRQMLTGGIVLAAIAIVVLAIVGWQNYLAAEAESWNAKHNLAVSDLSNAGFAIREHRTADALHWYRRAAEHAPIDDWTSRSALGLLGVWSKSLHCTLRHDNSVVAIAFSPNGQTVLTGSYDRTARLWDARTGQALGEPLRHDNSVVSVAFSPDSQFVLTGSADRTARIWDVRTGQARVEPLRHESEVLAVSFSPDGQMVLTGSKYGIAQLWDLRTGTTRGEPLKHDESDVVAVAFSPDGETILTASKDWRARLWDTSSGQARGEPLVHEGQVLAIAFSPDGQMVLTGCKNEITNTGEGRLWDVRTGQARGEPLKHAYNVEAVAFSPDGQSVLTGSWDNTARLWDVNTGQALGLGDPLIHDGAVVAVAFSPDGQTVVTGSTDHKARLWDVRTGQARGNLMMHEDNVSAVAFSPDGQTVLTGSWDGTARLWGTGTVDVRGRPMMHEGDVSAVAFSPDGQMVLTGSSDLTARLWDVRTGQLRGGKLKHEGIVSAVAFSPDGQTLLTGSWDQTARLWDARTGQLRGGKLKHEGEVVAVAFSPDGQTLLTGSCDQTARLWDAHTGKTRCAPLKHEGDVSAVAFSPDGQMVLTGSSDLTARLWDAHSGQSWGEPLKHVGEVCAVAFSPDGQSVLTGSTDKMARLWNMHTGQLRSAPLRHEAAVVAVAFSPDGQTLLTGSLDHTARLWDAHTGIAWGEPFRHDEKVNAVAYSSDGHTVLTGSDDESARLWVVPPLSDNEPERLRLSVDVRTGSEFDENSGAISPLSQTEWLKRQARLWKEFGGPCDVSTWD